MLIVGKCGAPFGIRGFVKLFSYNEPPENIFAYQPWQIYLDGQWQTAAVEQTKIQGTQLLVKFTGCDDRTAAQYYVNAEIGIERRQLPMLSADEYYWTDLIGLQVINQNNVILGKVARLVATGSNDVLVVKGDKEHWIPFLPGDYVVEVNRAAALIRVNWDENF